MKQNLRKTFHFIRPLKKEQLLGKLKLGSLFVFVQCDIQFPVHLRGMLANFPPISKNINVCRQDTGPILQNCAEKEGLMSQPRQMLISSFELKNGTIITPLLLF